MDTMDITLIVKASNQQFEDQTIKCEPSWTIRRLKGHLTEVYPGKPSTDEQKLIYSGQLLGDSVVLKDILRHYDGQEAHTVHLVFTPKNNRHTRDFGSTSSSSRGTSDQQRSSKSMSPKPSTSSSDGAVATASTSAGSSSRSACEDPAAMAGPSGSGTSFGADGLRQRNVVTNATQGSSETATNPNPVAAPVSAEYIMSQHLAMQNWMQQVYAQYLNQCMSVISGQSNPQAPYASAPINNPATAATPPQLNPMAAMTSTLPPPPPLAASIVNSNPLFAQTLPNLAYYPYLSAMNSFPMPSASSIPAPISSSGTIPVSTPAPTSQPPTIPVATTPAPPEAVAGPSRAVPSVGGIQQPIASSSSSSTTATVNAASAQGTAQPAANPDQPADAAAVPGAAAEAAPAAARRFPNIVVEEQENRDWLDIFFSMCRVGILMTVVYLYSSPVRCISVLFIGVMLYLYQIGFFRNNNAERIERARLIVVQQINNAHGVRQNLNAAAAAAAANPAADDQPDNAGETDSADSSKGTSSSGEASESGSADAAKDAAGSQTEEMAPAEVAQSDDQQSAANVVPEANRVNVNDVAAFLRTLVLSFFTSIIPDTPAA